MAEFQSRSVDPRSGYCRRTKIYRSLTPAVPLPPLSEPLSVISYTLSLLHSTSGGELSSTAFLIDADTGHRLSYSAFLRQVNSLSSGLKSSISKNDVAFILSPPSFHVPVLYFSLLSLGVVISPCNPLSSPTELSHQIQLSKPSIAISVSAFRHKLPPDVPVLLLDSPEFISMLKSGDPSGADRAVVNQSDSAAILYSSGTTGKVKGVVLTHRNLITGGGVWGERSANGEVRFREDAGGCGEVQSYLYSGGAATCVGDDQVGFGGQLRPELTAGPQIRRSAVGEGGCGAVQGQIPSRGDRRGGVTRTNTEGEKRYGSVGRVADYMEAKIVDPATGESLPPGHRGELWLRGPTIMKGYAGDDAATAATLDSQGWLKTGDLCYFDSDGFLFIVDRLKELIKYKGYQVPPAEIEQLLLSMPELADAAVIPYPDEEAGQIPMAYVVRKPGSVVSAMQIMGFIAKQVAPYKKIRRVAFVDSIPKSPAGKILRRELVDLAQSSTSSKL